MEIYNYVLSFLYMRLQARARTILYLYFKLREKWEMENTFVLGLINNQTQNLKESGLL